MIREVDLNNMSCYFPRCYQYRCENSRASTSQPPRGQAPWHPPRNAVKPGASERVCAIFDTGCCTDVPVQLQCGSQCTGTDW